MKPMDKCSVLLVAAVGFALSACGGSDSENTGLGNFSLKLPTDQTSNVNIPKFTKEDEAKFFAVIRVGSKKFQPLGAGRPDHMAIEEAVKTINQMENSVDRVDLVVNWYDSKKLAVISDKKAEQDFVNDDQKMVGAIYPFSADNLSDPSSPITPSTPPPSSPAFPDQDMDGLPNYKEFQLGTEWRGTIATDNFMGVEDPFLTGQNPDGSVEINAVARLSGSTSNTGDALCLELESGIEDATFTKIEIDNLDVGITSLYNDKFVCVLVNTTDLVGKRFFQFFWPAADQEGQQASPVVNLEADTFFNSNSGVFDEQFTLETKMLLLFADISVLRDNDGILSLGAALPQSLSGVESPDKEFSVVLGQYSEPPAETPLVTYVVERTEGESPVNLDIPSEEGIPVSECEDLEFIVDDQTATPGTYNWSISTSDVNPSGEIMPLKVPVWQNVGENRFVVAVEKVDSGLEPFSRKFRIEATGENGASGFPRGCRPEG